MKILTGYIEILQISPSKEQIPKIERVPLREPVEELPMKELKISTKRYDKIRQVARKKWILREIKRRERRMTVDTYSIATTID